MDRWKVCTQHICVHLVVEKYPDQMTNKCFRFFFLHWSLLLNSPMPDFFSFTIKKKKLENDFCVKETHLEESAK